MRLLPDEATHTPPPRSVLRAELARRSLRHFVRQAWHVLEPSTPLKWNWHLDAICDHVQALLEGRIPKRNLYIAVPPGAMKSTIVSVCAIAWWWLRDPGWRVICASGNPRVVTRDSVKCRDLIRSGWYQETFTPQWAIATDQDTKLLYSNTAKGFRQAVTTGAKVTGDRASALFWDDLLDAKDARSQASAVREAANYWYDHAFQNRLADPDGGGARLGIGQRLHEVDPGGHVLASGEYDYLQIPQVFHEPTDKKPRRVTSIGWTDPRTVEGTLMFPERFGPKFIASERKILGSAGFAAQHDQDPEPMGGLLFKRAWWKLYTRPEGWATMPVEELKKLYGIRRIVTGWDTALTESQEADFTSKHTIGESENRYYVLDHWMEKVEYPTAETKIITDHARWKNVAVPIEGKGSHSGKAAVQSVKKKSAVPAIEVPNIGLDVRAAQVSPTVEAEVVYLPADAEWTERFIESMSRYPKAAHDDDVASFCITMGWLLFGQGTTGMLEFLRQQAAAREAAAKAAAGGTAA